MGQFIQSTQCPRGLPLVIETINICFELKERKFKHLHEKGTAVAAFPLPLVTFNIRKTEMIKQKSDNEGTARIFPNAVIL